MIKVLQRGWQGLLTLPRAVFLADGDSPEIRTRPVEELKTLRDPDSHQQIHNVSIPVQFPFALLADVSGDQMEILLNWQFSNESSLNFSYSFFIDLSNLMF